MTSNSLANWYFVEFIVLMLGLWAMMFILDRIWPSNFDRAQAEKRRELEKLTLRPH